MRKHSHPQKVPVFPEGLPHEDFIICYQSTEYKAEQRKVPVFGGDLPQMTEDVEPSDRNQQVQAYSAHILRIMLII